MHVSHLDHGDCPKATKSLSANKERPIEKANSSLEECDHVKPSVPDAVIILLAMVVSNPRLPTDHRGEPKPLNLD
ncbi:hypothetical protein EVAR_103434_1 [Eumeta japonica]|uniref:Uncharacterized protein n=1 Tax=Eumeta variegata TaxID=151549 RepID=A0A4C1Z6M1_EUMVA|nr:hypothetical protein EVAR_103434_1 [Eumeta japonica]